MRQIESTRPLRWDGKAGSRRPPRPIPPSWSSDRVGKWGTSDRHASHEYPVHTLSVDINGVVTYLAANMKLDCLSRQDTSGRRVASEKFLRSSFRGLLQVKLDRAGLSIVE